MAAATSLSPVWPVCEHDQLCGVLSSLCAALRQVADLVGDHSESQAGFACPRRLCVQN
jgi:hypothetical protein